MKTLLPCLLLLALLSGCEFQTLAAPVEVIVSSEISAEEYALAVKAAGRWNAASPGSVVSVSRGERDALEKSPCQKVYIVRGACKRASALACAASFDGCSATVKIPAWLSSPESFLLFETVVAHELGHVFLGPEHSDIPGEIMSVPYDADAQSLREISASEAARVQ